MRTNLQIGDGTMQSAGEGTGDGVNHGRRDSDGMVERTYQLTIDQSLQLMPLLYTPKGTYSSMQSHKQSQEVGKTTWKTKSLVLSNQISVLDIVNVIFQYSLFHYLTHGYLILHSPFVHHRFIAVTYKYLEIIIAQVCISRCAAKYTSQPSSNTTSVINLAIKDALLRYNSWLRKRKKQKETRNGEVIDQNVVVQHRLQRPGYFLYNCRKEKKK